MDMHAVCMSSLSEAVMPQHLISTAELAARLGEPDLVVFDVRHHLSDNQAGRREFDAGHIPGAFFLDHERDLSASRTGHNGRHPLPRREDFAEVMSRRGVRPSSEVVAYDASGGTFAAHLWWMLRWLGHSNVQVLDGGWQAWVQAGYSVTQADTPLPVAGSEDWPVPGEPAVAVDEVVANLPVQRFTLLDARAANRYRGDVEPLDPVAGHIPGALNRPSHENLRADGCFKPPELLTQEFKALLAGRQAAEIVHQCGSGISACHNLLAMEIAGLEGSRLYAGSWSEWCADPDRPVAKG